MLKSLQDPYYPYFEPENSASDNYEAQPIDPNNFDKNSTVYRCKSTESKHKMWFILDKNLVLPEYIIELDYIMKD